MTKPADDVVCLHCGETPASIKRRDIVVCGIMSGYEQPELSEEFPRHRWADWNDRELDRLGVAPHAYDKNRRTAITVIEYIPCEDTKIGHIIATEQEDLDWVDRLGQCISCGATPHPSEGSTP